MRLLTWNGHDDLDLTSNLPDEELPPYAILSHTWGADNDEVTFADLQQEQSRSKKGYRKIRFCGEQAMKDGIKHFWVDSCCINKADLAELSEAIISMYRWYRNAERCYVYLSDVSVGHDSDRDGTQARRELSLRASRWFTRGWTLQELLAPKAVELFSCEGVLLGTKETLAQCIHQATTIPLAALLNTPLSEFPVIERMRWTERRNTKRKEDKAYCLLGIFDVFMPVLYGEGDNALRRLQKEINERHGGDVVTSLSADDRMVPNNQVNPQLIVQYKRYGLCLGDAPQIDADLFKGRSTDLEEMQKRLLNPDTHCDRRCVILGGIGGVGKTQLAIAFARQYRSSYSSIFWINATSEISLNASFRQVANVIFDQQGLVEQQDEEVLRRVSRWLSQPGNHSWLIIFDNYDEPNTYDITKYYPLATRGSIIVTTRLPSLVNGVQISVEPLHKVEDSLAIIRARSRRTNTASDLYARRLAERLAGLPLALATAGAYLERSTWSFEHYLEEYEKRWNVNPSMPTQLPEYRNRTLYTTWDLSYCRVQTVSPAAAQLLKALAYFDNQTIRYDLFKNATSAEQQGWRGKVAQKLLYWREGSADKSFHVQKLFADAAEFESLTAVLAQHRFIEPKAEPGSYAMHNCIHAWTLASLNINVDIQSYLYAFDCVTAVIDPDDLGVLGSLQYAESATHAARLTHSRFLKDTLLAKAVEDRHTDATLVAQLLHEHNLFHAAEQMYLRVLAGREKALGLDHLSTLETVFRLCMVYFDQVEPDKEKQMQERALSGFEKALRNDKNSILSTIEKLSNLCWNQNQIDNVKQTDKRALGPNHPLSLTLTTLSSLGDIYARQDKLDEAEQIYLQALTTAEKALGLEHLSTLSIMHGLGVVYQSQNKIDETTHIFLRALTGYEKTLGLNHPHTLDMVHELATLYCDQDKLIEAEQMYKRALAGREKALGLDHPFTLVTVHCLGVLYHNQGMWDETTLMYVRAHVGFEKVLGPDHVWTLDLFHDLGNHYARQGKLDEGEQMLSQALAGKRKALGSNHPSTQSTGYSLSLLYRARGRTEEVEQVEIQTGLGST